MIVSDDKMGGVHQFIIFNQQEIGRGAFGVVKRAIETENPYEPLAVKIIPFGSETKKAKIEREI